MLGAPAPKGQEMDDHYFGTLKPRVSEYMKDLDMELWKLGIPAKTKHNEVTPCQHELAPVFDTCNVAVDRNQLTMEMMKKVAKNMAMFVCYMRSHLRALMVQENMTTGHYAWIQELIY